MIKLKTDQRNIRETSADFEYNDGGELKTETIRVLYYSPTVAETKAAQKEIERVQRSDTEILWLSDTLLPRLHSLPNLCDEKGKPHKITKAFLESIDIKNLQRIAEAIREDLLPKSESSTSPGGSSPKGK